jgi:heme/copper-type cytochrome/quinol oxidase subunit 2
MLNEDNVIQVHLYTILVIGFLFVGLIVFLIGIILRLVKKAKAMERVRYGFGGKTLFSILIVGLLVVALPLSLYSVMHTTEMRKIAEAEKEVYIDIQSVRQEDKEYSVSFIAIPIINQDVWGKYTYTIEWNITGPISFTKIEKERNIDRPSYFKKDLPKGEYTAVVKVTSKEFSLIETKKFSLKEE